MGAVGGHGVGVVVPRGGLGSRVCLGTPKRRDGARVSAEAWGARGSAPRGLMTSGKAHNFSEPQLRGLRFASLDSGVDSIKRSTELSF